MQIINKTKNSIIADKAKIADTFMSRMIGLLNRKCINKGEALIITKCNSIHMFFMKFAIDAIFIDKNNVVVGLIPAITPFCLSPIFFKSSYVVEVPCQTIADTNTSIGDVIEISE